MSLRLKTFLGFEECPVRKKMFNRLRLEERDDCITFIVANDHLDHAEFNALANRLWLDAKEKPRHWVDMWGLLTECNGVSLMRKPRGKESP